LRLVRLVFALVLLSYALLLYNGLNQHRKYCLKREISYLVEIGEDAVLVQHGVSAGGWQVASEHLEGGGLAGAVHPQEPEALPLGHAEGQAVHGQVTTKLLRLVHLEMIYGTIRWMFRLAHP
jgi:hypothetical protein